MKLLSKRFFFSFFFLFSVVLGALPSVVSAQGIVPCGKNSGTAAEQAPCTVCHLIIGADGLIKWGLRVMTVIGLAVMVGMAVFYIVSAGDEGMMKTAKSGIVAVLIGFTVMLTAWLIVNTTLRIFSASIPGLTVSSTGFSFYCDAVSNVNK